MSLIHLSPLIIVSLTDFRTPMIINGTRVYCLILVLVFEDWVFTAGRLFLMIGIITTLSDEWSVKIVVCMSSTVSGHAYIRSGVDFSLFLTFF